MPFCHGIEEPLRAPILLESLLDFSVGSPCPLKIALVHDDNVGQVEHDDFLQLQTAAVIGIHHQDGLIDDSILLKRHRFLTSPDRFDDYVVESGVREESEAILRRRRESAGLSAGGHASHEYTIVLRINHGRAVAKQRALADHARIVRQNRDARLFVFVQKSEDQFIDQSRLSRSARSGKTDHSRFARISDFRFPTSDFFRRVFGFSELVGKLLIG